ncbi:hypothetical protein T265_15739, partial [Opisthorchis viverrini]
NPFKGKVFHEYQHEDVYKGVVIDYRGEDITRFNFMKVLRGDDKLEANKKKVLRSGPNDNVFIFFSGHGGTFFITFLQDILYATELNSTLAYMHSKKKYNKLVLYLETCCSGSMFKDVLPSNMGIYVTTSANEDETSHAIFCKDKEIDVCLANEYSYDWILDSEYNDLKKRTLEEQYVEVKRTTVFSHVMKYGEMAMGSLPVGKFQGHYDLPMYRKDGAIAPNSIDRKPYCQAHLYTKSRRFTEAATEDEHETALRKLHRALQLGHIVEEMFRDIVMDVTTHHKPTLKGLSKKDELMCFQAPNSIDRKPYCQAHLYTKSRRFTEAATEDEHETALRKLHRALQLGHIVEEMFRDIVMDVTTHHKPTLKGLSKKDELMCFQAVFDQFRTHCFTSLQAS